MLTRSELHEMKALTERVVAGSVSREDWANLAALTLVFQGDETVAAIAAEGLDRFIEVSTPIYEGHAFRYDDYRHIYDRVCEAAARYQRDLVRH
jgi:hypothetical protein